MRLHTMLCSSFFRMEEIPFGYTCRTRFSFGITGKFVHFSHIKHGKLFMFLVDDVRFFMVYVLKCSSYKIERRINQATYFTLCSIFTEKEILYSYDEQVYDRI